MYPIAQAIGIHHRALYEFAKNESGMAGKSLDKLAVHFGLVLVPADRVKPEEPKPSAEAKPKRKKATTKTAKRKVKRT